jgi:hypothetical protein
MDNLDLDHEYMDARERPLRKGYGAQRGSPTHTSRLLK